MADLARRNRRLLIAASVLLFAGGWAVFLFVHQDVGLLLVVFAGILLSTLLFTTELDYAGGPTDGPWYGETSPGGFLDGGGGGGGDGGGG